MSCTPQELINVMEGFYGGSDGRYRHWACKRFIYTEGVKAAADKAGFHWLIDIIATEIAPICFKLWDTKEDGRTFLQIDSKGSKADITVDDGNGGVPVFTRHIDFTTMPEGKWVFYLFIDGVVEYPHELLVMLLPQED